MSRRWIAAAALLTLASCAQKGPKAANNKASQGLREYPIRFGDTLETIAWRFDVPGGYPALAELNGIRNPHMIQGGEHLLIPPTAAAVELLPPLPSIEKKQPRVQACAATPLGAAVPTQINGCAEAACVDAAVGVQVCACAGDASARGIHVFDRTRPQLEWSVPLTTHGGDEYQQMGTVRDFEVVTVQLDDDPELELAVATLKERNDLNMSWWDLALLDGPRARSAVRLQVANYGEGSFVAGRGGRCDLLATAWDLGRRPGEEGIGYYLSAKRMAMVDGELHPIVGDGMWMRRLLYSFQPGSQVRATGLKVGTPAFDLAHKNTEWRDLEPAQRKAVVRRTPMLIRSSRSAERTEAGSLHLLTDRGTLIAGRGGRFIRLGDAASGRLYDGGYVPAKSLDNRQATFVEYASTWGAASGVLWLGDAP